MKNKIDVLGIEGEKVREINLPEFFSEKIREDIMLKAFYTKLKKQPHAPDSEAGKKHSASGNIKHGRRLWKTAYGKGISRVPRKIMWRRGTQFYWVGAEISSARGGRRAHPPKIFSMLNRKKINKKEYVFAMKCALASTASQEAVKRRYLTLEDKKIFQLPVVVESKLIELNTKQFLQNIEKILQSKGEGLFEIAIPKKTIRAGKGKMRGRRYKKNAGMLLVVGEKEKTRFKNIEIQNAKQLSIIDLFPAGRLAVYTENAIKELENRFSEKNKNENEKKQIKIKEKTK